MRPRRLDGWPSSRTAGLLASALVSAVALLLFFGKDGFALCSGHDPAVECMRTQNLEEGQEVISWARQSGGVVRLRIGKACDTCIRGAVTSEDIPEGGLVAKIPLSLSVGLGDDGTQARAYNLVKRMHLDPEFNKTYGPYIRNWAPAHKILAPEFYTPQLIEMLQSPPLEAAIRHRQEMAREWYYGLSPLPPLNFAIAPATVSLEQYSWVVSLLSTRVFGLEIEGAWGMYLLPVMDMVNNADPEAANAHWKWDDDNVYMQATRDLKAGEQLAWSYKGTVIHRNDMSIFFYGFVQDKKPQLLCAQDRADFNESTPFRSTPPNDDMGDLTPDAARKEVSRLQGVLESLPTTLEEDQALLKELPDGDERWRERTILRYRVFRKQAIAERIAALSSAPL